jgi:hypothetical protein
MIGNLSSTFLYGVLGSYTTVMELVKTSLRTPASLRDSAATTVFHTASPHAKSTPEVWRKVNIEGTDAGARLIHDCHGAGEDELAHARFATGSDDGVGPFDVDFSPYLGCRLRVRARRMKDGRRCAVSEPSLSRSGRAQARLHQLHDSRV